MYYNSNSRHLKVKQKDVVKILADIFLYFNKHAEDQQTWLGQRKMGEEDRKINWHRKASNVQTEIKLQ